MRAAAVVGAVFCLVSCSSAVPSPSAFPSDDAFAQLITTVAGPAGSSGGALDATWRAIMAQALLPGEGPYRSPANVVPYRGGYEVPNSPCAATKTLRFWQNNARYCESDSSIYYDAAWLRDFTNLGGDFAPVAILAHEWGHHIQAVAQIPHAFQIQAELQADCFAGMFFGSRLSAQGGVATFSIDELTSGLATFFDIGNRQFSQDDWMSPAEHGSQLQRMMAFGTGWLGASGDWETYGNLVNGYPWCFGYQGFAPASFSNVGPYRLINLPGRAVVQSPNVLTIGAQLGTAYTTSELRVYWLPDAAPIDPLASPEALVPALSAAVSTTVPGATALTPPSHLDLAAGAAAGFYLERPTDSVGGKESGVVELLTPKTGGGGLVIFAVVPEPAVTDANNPADLAVLYEHLGAISELANRLCGPGESLAAQSPFGNVACANDQ